MATTISGVLKDAKAALLALIEARDNLDGVQVSPTHPGGSVDSTTTVFVNEANGEADWAQLGQRQREINPIIFEVVIQTARSGGIDQQAVAESGAWDLAAEVEEAVRADPTIDGTVRAAIVTNAELTNVLVDTTWAAQIVLTIQAAARIT